jgi:hypothetical protein
LDRRLMASRAGLDTVANKKPLPFPGIEPSVKHIARSSNRVIYRRRRDLGGRRR